MFFLDDTCNRFLPDTEFMSELYITGINGTMSISGSDLYLDNP